MKKKEYKMTGLEALVFRRISLTSMPLPELQYRFHPERKWRFDFAWPDLKIAVEVEGGVFSGGGHVRGSGYSKDCDKYNAATVLGWKILRCTTNTINTMVDDLQKLIQKTKGEHHGTKGKIGPAENG